MAGVARVAIAVEHTGRPYVDTLGGSKHTNMKEIRFEAGDGGWRVAFAFDPARSALLRVAGDKSGVSQKQFYRTQIDRTDRRLAHHLSIRESREKQT